MIAVLRRPSGLYLLEATRDAPFAAPDKDAPCAAARFVESVEPLSAADAPYGELLLSSLDTLRAVQRPSPEVLAALFHVLVGSVPDPGAFSPHLPLLRFDQDSPVAPRPTAAHPRAFRGTKHKPPKASAPATYDLLPHLDGGKHEAALLHDFEPHLERAFALCERDAGYGHIIRRAGSRALSPYGQVWEAEAQAELRRMPASFRRYFLWRTRGVGWPAFKRLIAHYWTLGLDQNPELRLLVARGLLGEASVRWCGALASAAPSRRACLAELSGPLLSTPDEPETFVEQLEDLCTDSNYRHRCYQLLQRRGQSTRYLLDGFRLANRYRPDYGFDERGDGHDVYAVVETIMERLQTHPGEWERSGFAMTLWRYCGNLEQLSETLRDLPWSELDAETAYLVAEFLGGVSYHGAADEDDVGVWACVRARARTVVSALQGVPPAFRDKAHRCLCEVLDVWHDGDQLAVALDEVLALVPRLCRPPFSVDGMLHDPLSSLTGLPPKQREAVYGAPDASFLALDKATRRQNDGRLIGLGLWSLGQELPELTARAFRECPAALCRTAKVLGCLSVAAAMKLLARLRTTRLFQIDPAQVGATELLRLVDDGSTKPSPLVSKRLRAHVEAGVPMSQAQLARAVGRVTDRWAEVLLSRVHDAAMTSLAAWLPPKANLDDPAVRHALMMQPSAEENRRAIRKALRARIDGDATYVVAHPESQAWLRRHPAVDATLWHGGLVLQRSIGDGDGAREVRLDIERDPLEVLRMGTYVGTCLGLGGSQAYSAAAVVLDINKCVVYCRDASGTVLARQLLAISEREQLYCFAVYPDSTQDEIVELFWEYDRAFANALGLPLYDPSVDATDGEVDIAYVLAKGWWYDSAVEVEGRGSGASPASVVSK